MSDVQFDEENALASYSNSFRRTQEETLSTLQNLVIKTGLISSKVQADYVLGAIALICFLATCFVFFSSSGILSSGSVPVSKEKMIEALHQLPQGRP